MKLVARITFIIISCYILKVILKIQGTVTINIPSSLNKGVFSNIRLIQIQVNALVNYQHVLYVSLHSFL